MARRKAPPGVVATKAEVGAKVVGTYAGVRITSDNKLGFFWSFPDRESIVGYVKNPAPASIGESWEFTRSKDGQSIMYGTGLDPTRRGFETANEEHREKWEAESVAAEGMMAHKRMNKKLAERDSYFESAMRPLKALMDRLQYTEDRGAFVMKVVGELMRR